jgi:hypothetical protein
MKAHTLALLGTIIFVAPIFAAERSTDTGPSAKTDASRYSDRDRSKAWNSEKDKLEQVLKAGHDKEWYRRELEKMGYKITSVNYDKPDYVEWEIVKDGQTYEVQLDLDKSKNVATKVDVATNMWKADATEKALRESERSKTSTR